MKNVVFIKTDMKLEYGTKFTEVTKSKKYCSVVKGINYSVVKHCIVEAIQ